MSSIDRLPLVSVLITVYNGMPYIEKTLASLLCQSYRNVEIVVVDDGSDDETQSVVSDMARKDDRIKILKSERIGRGKALNFGIKHCGGEYIAINDADDLSLPCRIEKQVGFLQSHPEHVLVGSMSRLLNLETGELTHCSKHRPVHDEQIRQYFFRGQPIQHVCVVMRKKSLEDAGGYNEKIDFLFDRDLFIRLAAAGGKLHNLEEVLVHVGHHPGRFFYHGYTGKERVLLDFHYRARAAALFGAPFKTKIKIWLLLKWNLMPSHWRERIKWPFIRK